MDIDDIEAEIDLFISEISRYPYCKRSNEMVKLEARLMDAYCPLVVTNVLNRYRDDGKFTHC